MYDHLDTEHLEWGLREAGGRGSLIVTDGVFSMDGDVAPLERIVELARRYDARVMVDEAHATGVLGPGGRGSVAAAGLEGEVDVIVGTLGKALGGYGAYVCCDGAMARYLVNTARTLIFSTGPRRRRRRRRWRRSSSCCEQPRRIERLAQRRDAACRSVAEGFARRPARRRSCRWWSATPAARCRSASGPARGVFAQAIRPPTVPEGSSRLRLAAMATHNAAELQWAARSSAPRVEAGAAAAPAAPASRARGASHVRRRARHAA